MQFFTEQGSSASRKSNGCYCKIARLWRTSRWCSLCLHASKIGGRSQIAQNSKVRMSARMDTSCTTQMAQIMGKHWRSCGTSRTKFMWTPIGRIVVGRTVRGSSIGTWTGRKALHWECLRVHPKQGLFLSENVDDTWMQTEWNYCWGLYQDVRITFFLLEHLKNYQGRKSLRQRRLHGLATWTDMLESALSDTTKWQTEKVEQILQSFKSLLGWPSIQTGRTWISRRSITILLTKLSSKCLHLARNGRPDILWSVNKLARAVTKWTQARGRRLARLISYIHHTNDNRQFCQCG